MTADASINRRKLNAKKYGRLLARTLPRVIRTDKENELMLAKVWDLMKRARKA
jgi:hypothetical protein